MPRKNIFRSLSGADFIESKCVCADAFETFTCHLNSDALIKNRLAELKRDTDECVGEVLAAAPPTNVEYLKYEVSFHSTAAPPTNTEHLKMMSVG